MGSFGTILRTTNGGTTWTSQSSGTETQISGVSFTDANNGTAVGLTGTILRTTTGGINPFNLNLTALIEGFYDVNLEL